MLVQYSILTVTLVCEELQERDALESLSAPRQLPSLRIMVTSIGICSFNKQNNQKNPRNIKFSRILSIYQVDFSAETVKVRLFKKGGLQF